jgi:hypothetical protein
MKIDKQHLKTILTFSITWMICDSIFNVHYQEFKTVLIKIVGSIYHLFN